MDRGSQKAILFISKIFNKKRVTVSLPCIIFILFGLIYFTIVICNHYFFRTYAFDYGAYNFAFYDYAHFRISENPVYNMNHINHMSFLQDHVSFTLMLFIPLYWVLAWLTGTYTLLIVQTCIIIYGAWAVYKLIEFKTNNHLLSLLALIQYFILAGRWTSFFSDCNLAIMASSLVPVLLLYFERKNLIPAILVFVFILLTREDMALWTAFIALFLFIIHFKDSWYRKVSVIFLAISIIYFILIFTVFIPLIETPYKKFTLFNYSVLGENPYKALIFILKHPFNTIKLLFVNNSGNPTYNNVKFEFYIYYFLCGGFLLLFRPKYILLFIPILAKKMLNDVPVRWSMELYYSIEFVSILPVVVFLIISEIKNRKLKNFCLIIVCIATLFLTIYKLDSPNRKLKWWGDSKYAFYKAKMFKAEFNVKKVNRYLNLIPDKAKVSASGKINPHLAFREKIYYFPWICDAEYIATFLENDTYPLNKKDFFFELCKYLEDDSWNIIVLDYPFLLMKKEQN